MDAALRRQLILEAMPSRERLAELEAMGVRRMVNLCGINLAEIYDAAAVAPFETSLHVFADIFTAAPPALEPADWDAVDPNLYLEKAGGHFERGQLLRAIRVTHAALQSGQPVFVFCGQGQGRSPLVAAGALLRLGRYAPNETLRTIKALQPRTRFTDISLSALKWSQTQADESGDTP